MGFQKRKVWIGGPRAEQHSQVSRFRKFSSVISHPNFKDWEGEEALANHSMSNFNYFYLNFL